jgi:hypothetical protein
MNNPPKSSIKAKVLTGLGILSILALALVFFSGHASGTESDNPRQFSPGLATRLAAQVNVLKAESLEESLQNLSQGDLYFWPGPPRPGYVALPRVPIPLRADVGQLDLESIMSNRRFRKLLFELESLHKAKASEVVRQELESVIPEYLALYDADLQAQAPHFTNDKATNRPYMVGPVFSVGNQPDGKIGLFGARHKVLALVWISGILGLNNSDQVERVTRLALQQRAELYDHPDWMPFFKYQMLQNASLYNRQLLLSALLGTSGNHINQTSMLELSGAEWRERSLAHYTAALTEYDLPVRSGLMEPDYSLKPFKVGFVSPLDDIRFDLVIKEFRLTELSILNPVFDKFPEPRA